LILNDAELMSRPLVVKTIGLGLGPILTLTGTSLGFVKFFEEFIERCMFKWEITLADRSTVSVDLFNNEGVQAWLTSIAWTESLMFSVSLFYVTASVCWMGLLYRYAKLDAFAIHRAVLVGLETDTDDADATPATQSTAVFELMPTTGLGRDVQTPTGACTWPDTTLSTQMPTNNPDNHKQTAPRVHIISVRDKT